MRAFTATKRDDRREVMRVELTAADVEVIEGLIDRLERLAQIEDALEVVAVPAISFLGQDIPTVTKDGTELLRQIVRGWDPEMYDNPDQLLVEINPESEAH